MLRQKDVIKTLVENYPSLNFEVRSNPKRLGNIDNVNQVTLVKCIQDSFHPIAIELLNPGQYQNPSRTYTCIKFITMDDTEYFVVNCNKVNKGKVFEDSLYDLLAKKDESIAPLLEYLGISLLDDYKVLNTGRNNTARNIYDSTKDSGQGISDITIIHDGVDHYLSLKAKNGTTLYSGKNINFIIEQFGKIDIDYDKFFTSPHGLLFDTLEIDLDRVVSGLYTYMAGASTDPKIDNPIQIIEESAYPFIRNLLVNAWSYGYHLIYEKSKVVKALDLTQLATVKSLIGKIEYATVIYPSNKSKQLSILITVKNYILDVDDLYMIEFRNTKGKILPLEMKVRKM